MSTITANIWLQGLRFNGLLLGDGMLQHLLRDAKRQIILASKVIQHLKSIAEKRNYIVCLNIRILVVLLTQSYCYEVSSHVRLLYDISDLYYSRRTLSL